MSLACSLSAGELQHRGRKVQDCDGPEPPLPSHVGLVTALGIYSRLLTLVCRARRTSQKAGFLQPGAEFLGIAKKVALHPISSCAWA